MTPKRRGDILSVALGLAVAAYLIGLATFGLWCLLWLANHV